MMLTFPYLKRKSELEPLGINISVVKPLGASELEAAILNTLGVDKADSKSTVDPLKRHVRIPHKSLKILVAEDTPFNQKFILRLLQRWNHQTTLVENGVAALEVLQKKSFDIVLMDVQMPEMDGLTATKKFRRWELAARKLRAVGRRQKASSRNPASGFQPSTPKLPIIAMTAHAIKGDRERCLDAGMDEYVSKPIDSDKLFDAIESLTRKTGKLKPEVDGSLTKTNKQLLSAFDGDWRFLNEVIDIFLSDYPRLMSDLRRASLEGDSDLLMRSAHSLKGMLKNFQADSAAEIAYEIEKTGKAENFGDVQIQIENLTDGIKEVDKMLRAIVEQHSG
jgi:CheY-like chemotaxis protein